MNPKEIEKLKMTYMRIRDLMLVSVSDSYYSYYFLIKFTDIASIDKSISAIVGTVLTN